MVQVEASRNELRYLWAFTARGDWIQDWHARLLARRQASGFDVRNFLLTNDSILDGRWIPFPTLDQLWQEKFPPLMQMYEQLESALTDRDVLIHYNGANLHPEFVEKLDVLKVFTCADDPESSEILSKPVVHSYDLHLVNNAACIDLYRSWGLENVFFWPLGSLTFPEELVDLDESQRILDVTLRDVPVVLIAEAETGRRKRRFQKLVRRFPQAECYGRGWPSGYVPRSQVVQLYRRAQVGWNIHNSLGPVNFRTYELAAHGVLQICDNKKHLGRIYEVGREAIGFESIRECVRLTRYFLDHQDEQRQVALAGRTRWQNEYTPDAVWNKLVSIVRSAIAGR